MEFDLFGSWKRIRLPLLDHLKIGTSSVPVDFVRNPRARKFILRVRQDGSVRVTIPPGGSLAFAEEFVQKNENWIQKELDRRARVENARSWADGSEILFNGESVRLTSEVNGELKLVRFAGHVLALPAHTSDYRPSIEQYLWHVAGKELVPRTLHLAAQHHLAVARVVVRNQRSRWGSCSPKRTISLNWRLIQAPPFVRDYLILHELMHLREMNHSTRFWNLVASACPEYRSAEEWLDRHANLLR